MECPGKRFPFINGGTLFLIQGLLVLIQVVFLFQKEMSFEYIMWTAIEDLVNKIKETK